MQKNILDFVLASYTPEEYKKIQAISEDGNDMDRMWAEWRQTAHQAKLELVMKGMKCIEQDIDAEGDDHPEYWIHLEVSALATLADLDSFLRDIWLECCGHPSVFRIGTTDYSSEPEDFSFFGDEQEEDERNAGAEQEDTTHEVEAIIASLPSPFIEHLPPDMLPEMKKRESIDDLLDYLHTKRDAFYSPVGLSPTKELRDRFLLWTMLGQFIEQLEDRGMDTPLEI